MKNKLKNIKDWFNRNFGWFFSPPYKQGKEHRNKKYR